MARFVRWGLAILSSCFLGAGALQAMAQDGQTAAYVFLEEPFAPYSQGEVGGEAQGGISLEILQEVFSRMGAAVELQLLPWARALKSVEHGRADGLPLLMKSEEREAYLVFSDPVVENREFLYYLPERLGEFEWEGFEDLKGYTLGLVIGYTYGDPFLEALETHGFKVMYSTGSESNLRLLMAERVDFILEDETLIGPILDSHPEWAEVVRPVDKPVSSYYWYMGISRLSPLADRIDEINQALASMREDGSLEAILEKR